jgi:YidC/Oxa1 family membrane protein insertase
MMGQMSWLMTGMFVFFALQVPSGLSLYWVVGNALALAQQVYVNRQKTRWETESNLKIEAIKANSKSSDEDDDLEDAKATTDKGGKQKEKQSTSKTPKKKSRTKRKRRKRR